MKKVLQIAALLALFTVASTTMFAQENDREVRSIPKWISDKGFWIIESNIKTPDTSVIHFYNNDNVQVYSEKMEGITLNLKKRKTLMRLKKALEESLLAWDKSHLSKDNAQLVSNIFSKDK